jgi:hypothetical protein
MKKSAARAIREPAPASEAPEVIHLPPPADIPREVTRHGSEKRQRSDGVFVRLLPPQKARLKSEAADAGMTIPAYLLEGRLGPDTTPPRRRPRRIPTLETEALMKALVAFNRANNNLNQTTHTGNTMMLFADEYGSERLADHAADLARAVENLRADMAPALAAILAALDYDSGR